MRPESPRKGGQPGSPDGEPSGATSLPESRPSTNPGEEPDIHGTIVVKIGGSTLGGSDSTFRDLALLRAQGVTTVVVHGGGKVITEWTEKQGIRPSFVRGLRVTDAPSLDIVVAVLTGLVNKTVVASLLALGCRAMGMSGVDGGMLQSTITDAELGLVGTELEVDIGPIQAMLSSGFVPVIAPVALHRADGSPHAGSLLNVNGDTAAGEIAAALGASRLVFLTDVEGVLDSSRRVIPRLTGRQASGLVRSNLVAGGMLPKLEGCLTALRHGSVAQIVDGRRPGALLEVVADKRLGTRIG